MGANKTVLLHGSDGRRCDWGMPRLRAKLSMRGRGLRRRGRGEPGEPGQVLW